MHSFCHEWSYLVTPKSQSVQEKVEKIGLSFFKMRTLIQNQMVYCFLPPDAQIFWEGASQVPSLYYSNV